MAETEDKPKKPIQDSELLTAIKAAESLAEDGDLRQERQDNLDQYLGEPYGNEVSGRSQVVDKTIQNTVEWIKPQLLKVFCSGDEVVKFNPKGPEDVKAAEQETDYINYIATQRNNFFSVCYEAFSDALIQKNAYIKAWWDESEDISKEHYDDLSDDEFAFLAQDQEIEIIEHETEPDEVATAQREAAIQQLKADPNPQAKQQLEQVLKTPKPMSHSVTVQRKKDVGCIKMQCLPPENTLVSHNANNISLMDGPFFEHWELKTISDLRLEGFDVDDDIGGSDEGSVLYDYQQRGDPTFWSKDSVEDADPSMRRVKVREVWIRYDDNGDGKAELIHAIVVGNDILLKEEADLIPVASLCPQLMPHRHIGLSISDAVADLQLIKTVLLRGFLDNLYLANNGRYGIDVDRVSLEDMLTSRPGGVVRVTGSPGDAIMPLTHQANFAPVMQGLAYIDDAAESRTGVTKYTQGLDANNLNKTATGVQAIMSSAQERVMLIARLFAETGIKELFQILHYLVRTHQNKPEIIQLRNEWVAVDPRSWRKRTDMTVTVGLGTGNKQEQLAHLGNLFQMQMGVMQVGLPIVQPNNVYETLKQIAKNAGFRQPEQFVSDPEQMGQQQPKQDPQMAIKQMELQADQQKTQAQMQAEAQKTQMQMQADVQKMQAEMQMEQQKFQAQSEIERQKAEQQQLQEQMRSQNDMQIEREKLQMQGELEKFKAQLKAETDLKVAMINAEIAQQKAMAEDQARARDQEMSLAMHSQKMEAMTRAKTVKRDSSGRVSGIE